MALVDSYSEANQSTTDSIRAIHPSASGSPSAYGQSFTGDGSNLTSCKFHLSKSLSPGNMIARLYAHTGTFGTSSVPTGAALDSSDIVDADAVLTGSLALYEFTGFSGYTMVDGTKYCIDVEAYDGTWGAGTDVDMGADASSPTHGGNFFSFASNVWAANQYQDACFYVYGEPAGWSGGDVGGVAIATIAKINGVALADIAKVNNV